MSGKHGEPMKLTIRGKGSQDLDTGGVLQALDLTLIKPRIGGVVISHLKKFKLLQG